MRGTRHVPEVPLAGHQQDRAASEQDGDRRAARRLGTHDPQWLSILEVTGQIIIVPPFFENFRKRLVKSPKIYWVDSGLACHLLGIDSPEALERSPFLGPLFEGFVASEIVKCRLNRGSRSELYWFRDHQGLEVDFLVPAGDRRVFLVEAKATKTVRPDDALPMQRLASAMEGYEADCVVVHRGEASGAGRVLRPGASAMPVREFVDML